MTSFQNRVAVLLMTSIALTAAPSFAQRTDRRSGGDRGGGEAVQRSQPRGGGQSSAPAGPQRQATPRRGAEPQRRAQPQGGVQARRRAEPRGRVAPGPGPGSNVRPYAGPRSGYRPYVNRSYVLPYGYRPYGYRPGWNLNLYFGRPYATYGSSAYGYYGVVPGRAYGAVRIVDAPRDGQVFVDGYYAGVVDDYDGVFQHLNLEAGPHRIEIEVDGYALVAFDVRIRPRQTITYRANIR